MLAERKTQSINAEIVGLAYMRITFIKITILTLIERGRLTVKHEIFADFGFIISLHVIFMELTIYYMDYLTTVKFGCM